MKTFNITTDRDLIPCLHYLQEEAELPVVVEIKKPTKDRSAAQNRLAFSWYKASADQLKDQDAADYRAYCKGHFGVPIRCEDEDFRKVYDEVIRPLSYEQKLAIMVAPIDLPVTRDMTVKQMGRYLEACEVYFIMLGVELPKPDDEYNLALGRHK